MRNGVKAGKLSKFYLDEYDSEFASRLSPQEWEVILDFRRLPDFCVAAQQYQMISATFYANHFILNKVVPEVWRFQMIACLLHLYDTRNPDDPRSGLTLVNFQKICTELKLASRGRAFAFLNIMRVGGYLSRNPSSRDARVVELEPTPVFIETVERWNHGIFQMIDAALPGIDLVEKHKRLPRLGWTMRRRSVERVLAGWKPVDAFPEIYMFVAADGGWMLLSYCVAKAVHGDTIVPVSVNLSEIGQQYGGSRSHLRRLLETAYAKGYLLAPPSNGSNIVLSPKLVCAYMTWIASYLGGYYRSATDALAELEGHS